MSIVIIRGPDNSGAITCMPPPLPREVIGGLVDRAMQADKTIAVRSCSSEQDILHALDMARQAHAELVLLDPGSCARSLRLASTMQQAGLAYIEVHDDSCDCPEAVMDPESGRLALVNGYMAQSYTLALDIGLEHLGYAECVSDLHVGT